MLATREHNGKKGEDRTLAILSDEFWILKRNVDVEGADFLVQVPVASMEEMIERRNRIASLGIVQSKHFEGRNQVRIGKKYIYEGQEVCPQFFAFLHTNDEAGRHHYFFTARELADNLYESKCGGFLCFSLTKSRDYGQFRDLPESRILSTIKAAVLRAEHDRNERYVKRLYEIFELPTQHYDPEPRFSYLLTHVDSHPVVLCRNERLGDRHLLEYRRDLFKNFGNFTWGYVGTGSYFLATCLLAHHFDGAAPPPELVERLLRNLLQHLPAGKDHCITSSDIRAALVADD